MHGVSNRRVFLKVSRGTALAPGLTGATFSWQSSAARAAAHTRALRGEVSVHHEWGTLREVVCSIPFATFPTRLPESIYNSDPTEGLKFMEDAAGKSLQEAAPEPHHKAREQMDGAVAILVERDVKVQPTSTGSSTAAIGFTSTIATRPARGSSRSSSTRTRTRSATRRPPCPRSRCRSEADEHSCTGDARPGYDAGMRNGYPIMKSGMAWPSPPRCASAFGLQTMPRPASPFTSCQRSHGNALRHMSVTCRELGLRSERAR